MMQIQTAVFQTSAPNFRGCPPPRLPEFAFIGRSNVGKSSLVNLLAGQHHLAKVSDRPGKTQLLNFFTINGAWTLVDLPGYGYARVGKHQRADFNEAVADYLEQRESLQLTFVLIDSRLPPQAIDREFLQWMVEIGAPFALIFTKADKQSASQTRTSVERFLREVLPGIDPAPATFVTSIKTKAGRREILAHIGQLLGGLSPG